MSIVIGIVGPHDLVDEVAEVCEEQAGVTPLRLVYDHESEAAGIVEAYSASVGAWLFTGIVPYTLAHEAGTLSRAATFVDYMGATLLQALVRLLHEKQDITRLSVDTLPAADVLGTLREAGLPTDGVRTLPYRPGQSSEDVVAFHRRHHRGAHKGVAVTCLSSAYDVLAEELPALRLAPSSHSVRVALRQLLLAADNQAQEDAHLALGLVDLPEGGDEAGLLKEVAALGGSVARAKGGTHMIITTRGPLASASGGFTALPMLRRLADRHAVVRLGFGLGRSAAEAESLARRALARARRIGDVAAVVSLRGDTDLVLESDQAIPPAAGENLAYVAQRVGLSVPTLQRLQGAWEATGAKSLTTSDVATHLGVQQRTARRLLHRLEMAGLAEREGNRNSGPRGRPLTLYRLTL
ncbi:hypothetical protein [Phytohabitans kaempferiae]|uniref:Transcriptional regulator n=1 Tax=Phytohabitans kaempferiae TaxID=1620943 RepID=A0ABV6MCH3_9ACTN